MSNQQEKQPIEIVNKPTEVDIPRQPIYIKTLNVFTGPARKRYEKHYKESKKHLAIDLIFIILILLLIASNIILITKSFPIENVEIKINHQEKSTNNEVVFTEPVVDTNLILNSSVAYYNNDGDQLGSGPWPPIVEEISTLRVFVSLKPDVHSASNIVLKIQLPTGVVWTDNFVVDTGNALTYDSANNLIYWQIDQLVINQSASANFALQINPKANDLAKKLKLVDWISVSATDMLTKNIINQTLGSLFSPIVE
ncbi:hypothetical protein ACFL1Y_00605 [Patescibacteria group bacterium]